MLQVHDIKNEREIVDARHQEILELKKYLFIDN